MKYPKFMCGTCDFGSMTLEELLLHIKEMDDQK